MKDVMLIYVLYCLFKFRVKEAIDVVYWADYFELKLRYANFNFTKTARSLAD